MRFIAKLFAITLVPMASAFAATQSVVLDVQNMTCPLCPVTVRKALQRVPGVEDATVNFDHKTATVRFDPAKADIATLVKATTNAGYPSIPHK